MENRNQLRMKNARRKTADIIRQQRRNCIVDSCPEKSFYYRKQLRSRNRKRMSAVWQEHASEAIPSVDEQAELPMRKKVKKEPLRVYM